MGLIALGVTGGIGAYKAVEVARGLQKRGHEVVAVMTHSATRFVGPVTFELIRRYVRDIVTVPDAELIRAMRFALERMKIVIEPTGALALAALMCERVAARGERVGVIISGGNVDVAKLAEWIGA